MMKIACIIGTDTEIGKTYSCCKIMEYIIRSNQTITALKPIASGVSSCEYGLLNEDVYRLFKANGYPLNIDQINQFSFKEAIAPHLAAKLLGERLNTQEIINKTGTVINQIQDKSHIIIEGVGGLMAHLNDEETYLDLLIKWNYPILLVVGMKLGCLNHALLTESILSHNNLPIVGWVANQIEPSMLCYQENLEYLTHKLTLPLLATINYQGQLQPSTPFKEFFHCH